jgi:tRNA G10  N-methylase Trm11
MRIVADAHRLPLAEGSVDVVVSNPPYPGNGHWDGDWWRGLKKAVRECQRVLRPEGRGWFLVRNPQGAEQWLTFDKTTVLWAHEGRAVFERVYRLGIVNWGMIPDADVVPLIVSHTRPGDVVLDPFAGRGCVLKLAARLGRVPLGADIDAAQLESGGRYA